MKFLSGLIIGFVVGILATIGVFELMRGDVASLAGRPPAAPGALAPVTPAPATPPASSGTPATPAPAAAGTDAGAAPKTTP